MDPPALPSDAAAHVSPWQWLPVDGDLGGVSRAGAALQGLLPARLAGTDRHLVEIALVEVLSNIVRHGYAGQPGRIEFGWREHGSALEFEVRDWGRPIPAAQWRDAGPANFAFDPTDIAHLPESGLGLALVKAAFDGLDYRSEDGLNRMRLHKLIA